MDGGGWTGGEFVLGGVVGGVPVHGSSRREAMAKAAEERVRKQREVGEGGGGGGGRA